MFRIIRIAAFFVKLILAYIAAFFLKLFCKEKRNIWIISERGDDARDNAWFFFRYMVEQHPQQPIYYVIKSSSADAAKVQAIGNAIETNSFRHFLYYALSTVRISSSMWGGDLPYTAYFFRIRKYMLRRRKFVFLKHGIIKDYLPQHCHSSCAPDLYICGAKPEYDYVKKHFGHPEGVVKYTGLARFDNLHRQKTKSQILVMPTFRRWLQTMTDQEVSESEYIAAWNKLLNDPRIGKLLEEKKLKLIFYPHYVMQKHIADFHTECPNIIIAKFDDYDVQTLLIESKLLVTDFSSVFFDFAYMEKPSIYYQFDRERYIKEHYDFTKGYFSYDANGFGDVVFDHEALMDAIERTIRNNFKMEDVYQKRLQNFFVLKDSHNCDRIYGEIEKLLQIQ